MRLAYNLKMLAQYTAGGAPNRGEGMAMKIKDRRHYMYIAHEAWAGGVLDFQRTATDYAREKSLIDFSIRSARRICSLSQQAERAATMTIPSHIKALLCLLLLAWTDPALACSCLRSTPQQHMQRHALIFSGTVEAVDHKAGRARFRVHTLYKGEAGADTIEINYNNAPASACGTEFTVGTVPTVFAFSMQGGPQTGSFTTGTCSMIPYASNPLAYQPALDAYRLAVSEARTGTSQEPGSIKAWLVLAELQERNRDYLAAARTFARLQALAPREAAYATRQGSALFELGRYGQALGAYQRALAIVPNDEAAKRGREQSMVKLGRVAELDPSRRDYSGIQLPPSNFAGRELSGVRFVKALLPQATFAQARLAGADFSEAVLNDTDFRQAELRGARFTRITSYGANFSAADLSDTRFNGGKLFRVRFDGANLSNADLSGASLEDASFVRAKLAGMRLSGANLYRANLSGNDLTDMDLSGLQLQGVIFAGAKLVNVDLRNAVLSGPMQGIGKAPDLRGTDLTGAKLQGAAGRRSQLRALRLHDKMARGFRSGVAAADPHAFACMPRSTAENQTVRTTGRAARVAR